MLLYTTINDALHVCYQHNILYSVNVIWHMWNTRSATINQQSVTSVDHNDNIWCNTSRWCNSRFKDVYMSAQLLSFFTISIQCVLYCVWSDSLYCTYSPSQPSSSYRQLLRCYCSASWIYDASSQRKGGQAHRCWILLTVRICSMHLVVTMQTWSVMWWDQHYYSLSTKVLTVMYHHIWFEVCADYILRTAHPFKVSISFDEDKAERITGINYDLLCVELHRLIINTIPPSSSSSSHHHHNSTVQRKTLAPDNVYRLFIGTPDSN